VGTDLHTTRFDASAARRLFDAVSPMGSLIKGHYTDWVENPRMYPETGMGGANVGPEFTTEEYLALSDLCMKEAVLVHTRGVKPCEFMSALEQAVIDSGRWRKWLQAEEKGMEFQELSEERRAWLTQTGARYIWTQPAVVEARGKLYTNLSLVMDDPNTYVIERIQRAIENYIVAFNLFDSLRLLDEE
jgi:D-tagatose-1,6-bisphosphate aldolase subunit GatZ/KbaZ